MSAPETQRVMAAFTAARAEARFIGGCVRDAILKRPVKDIDIATPEPPDRVMKLLDDAGIRVIPTGLSHGTVTAIVNQMHFEITSLRIDVETDGRRARVAFTDDWTQDAARRDFTINTMSCDMEGNVYDPYEGLEDLGRGYIQFVGHAETRIKEDVLRLLRFFRFLAEYGRYPVNRDALDACRKLAPNLPTLSGERMRGELFRILTAPNPADTITKMRAERVLEYVLPEAGDVGRLRMTVWLVERAVKFEGVKIDPVRRLAALLKPGLDPQAVLAVTERLKFSNAERNHLLGMCAAQPAITETMDDRALRQACHAVGASLVMDRALLAWAAELALEAHLPKHRTAAWVHIIETAQTWKAIDFPLRGRDVQARGVNHGAHIGALLKAVEQWWNAEDFRPDRTACLEKLDALIQKGV
ncbi:MAG: CCA tRNA nucleotidyltransferase [Rhodospirillales bacterium]|nr:CCA tRNA nucleotidyltransferase [Rhodospirillales bacterium]